MAALRTLSCSSCAAAKASRWLTSLFRSSSRNLEATFRSGLESNWLRLAGEERDMFRGRDRCFGSLSAVHLWS